MRVANQERPALSLVEWAVYHVRGVGLVEAQYGHTWKLYMLDEDGQYVTGNNMVISHVQGKNGRWKSYFCDYMGAIPYVIDEIDIAAEDILFLAESVEALDFDGRFREIIAPMQWA